MKKRNKTEKKNYLITTFYDKESGIVIPMLYLLEVEFLNLKYPFYIHYRTNGIKEIGCYKIKKVVSKASRYSTDEIKKICKTQANNLPFFEKEQEEQNCPNFVNVPIKRIIGVKICKKFSNKEKEKLVGEVFYYTKSEYLTPYIFNDERMAKISFNYFSQAKIYSGIFISNGFQIKEPLTFEKAIIGRYNINSKKEKNDLDFKYLKENNSNLILYNNKFLLKSRTDIKCFENSSSKKRLLIITNTGDIKTINENYDILVKDFYKIKLIPYDSEFGGLLLDNYNLSFTRTNITPTSNYELPIISFKIESTLEKLIGRENLTNFINDKCTFIGYIGSGDILHELNRKSNILFKPNTVFVKDINHPNEIEINDYLRKKMETKK